MKWLQSTMDRDVSGLPNSGQVFSGIQKQSSSPTSKSTIDKIINDKPILPLAHIQQVF